MWKSISYIIKRHIKEKNFDKKLQEARIQLVWKEVVGRHYPRASSCGEVRGIKNRVLCVYVNNPLWIVELEGIKHNLYKELKHKTQYPLRGIVFYYRAPHKPSNRLCQE